jgi:methionyl-tRNA synthetase
VSLTFRVLMEKANISFDDWIRTTQPRHKAAVEEIWKRCVASGSIYKDKHEGWCEALHRRAFTVRLLGCNFDPQVLRERRDFRQRN